jgi:hypothetical protein
LRVQWLYVLDTDSKTLASLPHFDLVIC